MTIDEMIAVLEAYKRGEKIECSFDFGNKWEPAESPSWSFDATKYRIAKPAPKKVRMLCWLYANELRWLNGSHLAPDHWVRVPSEDKEIELP